MKVKKGLKVIGIILMTLIILIVLFLAVSTILFHIRISKAKALMEEKGYLNPVSAGDINVNVYSCGNPDGKHTIVALAGYLDGEMCIGWRNMTAPLEKDDRVVFLDRAGYGLSDDYKSDITPDVVVEQYRTALRNAGISAPYVLMPHSIGGVYTTYWVSEYPEEIEAVMIIDGTEAMHYDLENDAYDLGIVKWVMRAGKLGLLPPMINSEYSKELSCLPDDEKAAASALLEKTMSSYAATTEIMNMQKNCNFNFDNMKQNDVPKMYISIMRAFHTKDDLISEGWTADRLRSEMAVKGESDEEVYENYLSDLEETGSGLMPYVEKMGNCKLVELRGQHEIMFDKPEECGKLLKEFIDGLE